MHPVPPMPERLWTRARAQCRHQPTTPATDQPGPRPPRPIQNPSPEAEHPQNYKSPSPPRTEPGAAWLPGRQPTSPGTDTPSGSACRCQKNTTRKPPKPRPGQDHSPMLNPSRNPPLGKGRSQSKKCKEIYLMWRDRLFQD